MREAAGEGERLVDIAVGKCALRDAGVVLRFSCRPTGTKRLMPPGKRRWL